MFSNFIEINVSFFIYMNEIIVLFSDIIGSSIVSID